jgi:hypothetical protein
MISSTKPTFSTPTAMPKFPNIVIAGTAGVGKSAFLGSIGPEAKAMIVDPEQGSTTYHSAWFQAQETSAKLENLHTIGVDQMEVGGKLVPVDTAAKLVQVVEGALDYIIRTKNSDGYTLFALDSITEFQERFIRLHGATDPRQSYGALKEAMHGITIKARQAPIITVFTARLRAVTDEVSQREMVRPEVSPGVWSVTSGLFDQIGLFEGRVSPAGATKRVLDFNLKPRFPGKDRFGLGEIHEPTFLALLERLNNPIAASAPTPRPAAARPRPAARSN